ncbi:hypothetical protein PF005_g25665 [Phytophthora fragariae]|uniref:Reverse transcriptase RNase H-like domain-containing protein n=1 Tax=Phytophthora fragariae TaxID=53985 RepID=A0A6A4BQZ0_9STRA|nr:hypothetical protein PF003_g7419 [Phytophthora fragariae]KAE8923399.1 hypothetical protein PF009_g26351 [Phytophthora fragariae]KAE8975542.1 hypothetical protein PF011_g24421 [Phytophthora fragariae]KAE9073432.1 hypothetical protein PF010_g25077 [Phytophthora fragariae]KAE9073730.1 hypothetical protein PF007_g25694 [Phytophthora fragariae]
MPPEKIAKAKRLVSHAFHARNLARSEYRSLLGSLRHVATCIRPARVFLQRLRAGERLLHRTRRIPVSANMRDDLLWWGAILDSPTLNGIPLEYFDGHPIQDITILTDASDEGICAIDPAASRYLTYKFSPQDLELITAFHDGVANEFDINYRELLACAFTVLAWGPRWRQERAQAKTIHVHFRIDNTTAVSWQSKMAARNSRAQLLVRLLGAWELQFGLRFSSSHIPGTENTTADAGSRRWGSASHAHMFAELTQGWSQAPTPTSIHTLMTAWCSVSENTPLHPPPSRHTTELSATGSYGQPDAESPGSSSPR